MKKPIEYRLIPNLEWDPDDLADWLAEKGWVYKAALEKSKSGSSMGVVWEDAEKKTVLRLVFDRVAEVRYVSISGEYAEKYVREYQKEADVFYAKDVLLLLPFHAKGEEAIVGNIFLMAISAPPDFDSDYLDAFKRLLDSPIPMIRMETIAAMAYLNWSELIPLVEILKEKDVDAGVRRAANDFLRM